MKPKLRFKEFTDDWEEKKLGDIISFLNGRAYKQSELLENGKYMVLRVGNLFSNPEIYYSDMELDENKYISNGDLIYAWSATFGPRIWKGPKVIYHYHIWKLVLKKYDNKYFINYLLEFDVHRINKKRTGGTLTHITKTVMEDRDVLLPSLPEQEKIGTFLSLVDQRIEKAEKKVSLLKEEKKGWMQKLFQQEIRFKDEQGNDYPDWEEKKLGNISEKVQDGNYGASYPKNNELMSDGIPFLTAKNISGNKIEITDYISLEKNNELLKAQICFGDIILTNRGTFPRPVVLNNQITMGNIGPQLTLIRIKDSNYNNMYIYQYMLSNKIQKEILLESGGSTMGFISLKSTKELKIQFPSLPEQEKIANFLSLLDQRIEKEERKVELLKEEKKGLLQYMFV